MTDLDSELQGLQEDKQKGLMQLAAQQRKYAELLKSSMGQDMKDVLSGKVKVDFTEDEKRKNKSDKFWAKIKKFFEKWS